MGVRTLHSLLLQVLLFVTLLAGTSNGAEQRPKILQGKAAAEPAPPPGTVFNDKDVPAMLTLEGPTWKETTMTGYWLVKAHSPWCHHCKSLAPKWQTLYEYYYTSQPVSGAAESVDASVSFTELYNLKFAQLDCVAYGSACQEAKVTSFPAIILFKNGQEVKRSEGDRDIKRLGAFIEECLDAIRPGSRPQEGVEVPAVGATEFWPKGRPVIVPNSQQTQASEAAAAAAVAGAAAEPDAAPSTPEKPLRLTNPNGTSVAFTAESFQEVVAGSLDPWFVKFYAPWCPHCQRMAPSWAQMAREMKGVLDVGEVDCEAEKRLCRELDITSYPTIIFNRGPERVDYEGMRGLGDLVQYGWEAVEASRGVPRVNLDQFEALEAREEVIFVYFYDHATTSEDMQALERLPLSLIGRAKIVKSDDPELGRRFKIFSWPRLVVFRGGRAIHYEWLMPQDMRDVGKVREWMQTVWYPMVPELTAANARDIMDGKYVVLGILNRERAEDYAVAKREIKNAAIEWMERQEHQFAVERQELRDAKQLRIEEAEDRNDQRSLRNAKLIRINMNEIERKEVSFAWVDGVFWQRWIKTTFGISITKDGDKVIINDQSNHRYWDQTSTGNPIVPSRTSILETLTQIYAPVSKLSAKPTGSRVARAYYKARSTLRRHPVLFALAGIVVVTATLFLQFSRLRGRRRVFGSGGFLRLESDKEKGAAGIAAGQRQSTTRGGPTPNGKAD